MEKSLLNLDNAYNIPHMKVQGYACRTNIPSNTAFRGFGGPQAMMIIEHIVSPGFRKVRNARRTGKPSHPL